MTVAVALVNALTPGEAHGRAYLPPADDDLPRRGHRGAALGQSPLREVTAGGGGRVAGRGGRVPRGVRGGRPRRRGRGRRQVNALLASTGARPALDRHDGEGWHLHFHGARDGLASGWAAGCATGLAIVLGTEAAGRLGVCTAPRCDRVYVDTSRNGTRRFCSTTCQNRVKTAAFRSRHG